ncbi:MAG: hypothetical protein OTI36_20010, partial [Beijerinckiaceae bacterium]|nr:hypothetical protein [Beijerinckiaceae bacterium]
MRASLLAVSAALAFGALAPAFAQSPPDKPAEAQSSSPPAKGDEVLDPSHLPKARQGVKEEGNRVDALSPDEQRRLDRIKAKAAKAEADKAEAAKREAAKAEAAKAKAEAAKAVADRREAERQEAAKADSARRAAAQEAARQAQAAK